MGEVLHLYVCLVHRLAMKEIEEAEAVTNKGLKGCIHGRPSSRRQISLMDIETLDLLGVEPGRVKENITVRDMDFQQLKTGQQLRVGGSILEITEPCNPCSRMDEIRPGLKEELRGRRGWLCRVVRGGIIRRGSSIQLTPANAEADREEIRA